LSKRQIQKRLVRILDVKRRLMRSVPTGGVTLLAGAAVLLLLFGFGGDSFASVPDVEEPSAVLRESTATSVSYLSDTVVGGSRREGHGTAAAPETVTVPVPGLPRDAKPLEMVLIKAGSFIMGSLESEQSRLPDDWPAHEVMITRDFYIGKYEITQAQWEAVAGKHRFYYSGRPDHPAEKVSWRSCQGFIKKLNALGSGAFRLPTEAEWEYACRAGARTRFFFGDSLDRADEFMWWEGNNEINTTKEVGLKKPNPWGLFDMLGNVSEWCQDRWESPSAREKQTNPQGPAHGNSLLSILWTNRVFRGGAYSYPAWKCRAAHRNYEQSMDYHYTIGFRIVMDVPEKD